MVSRAEGIPPRDLADDDLRREMQHLHDTRHDVVTGGSESALETHTERMLATEQEFLRRRAEGHGLKRVEGKIREVRQNAESGYVHGRVRPAYQNPVNWFARPNII